MSKIFNNDFDNILKEIDKNILWQYDNATNLKTLIEFKKQFIKQYHSDFWKDFEKDIFNIDTANNFGLTLWGILLNVNRIYYVNNEKKTMDVETYRKFIKGRLYYMLMNCSTPQINTYLKIVFGEEQELINNTTIEDNEDMTINYVITRHPTEEELEMYFNTDILPRPAGVKLKLREIDKENTFGFNGSGLQSFNNGTFWDNSKL